LCGKAARVVEDYGYAEVNLNIDCPSERVSIKREFGAILMKKVDAAYTVVEAMAQATQSIPVSVKCRIGVDLLDDVEFVTEFVSRLRPVCRHFILHARKCVLNGLLNARQNRSVPPLNFPRVYEICRRFPDCTFWINGGIRTLDHARAICFGDDEELRLEHHCVPCDICQYPNASCTAPPVTVPPNLKGCMMGRAATDNPAMFADADRFFYGLESNPCRNRRQVLEQYCTYLEGLYPRRCCDDDPRITYKLPVPEVERMTEYCPLCRDTYLINWEQREPTELESEIPNDDPAKPKVASRIIGRSLKPIRGMFYGLPKSKRFIQTLDKLVQDMAIRNCGPGFLIRKASQVMPNELLDQEFARTEDGSQKYN
jgi:tRNA-dihydrouridine synthase